MKDTTSTYVPNDSVIVDLLHINDFLINIFKFGGYIDGDATYTKWIPVQIEEIDTWDNDYLFGTDDENTDVDTRTYTCQHVADDGVIRYMNIPSNAVSALRSEEITEMIDKL